MLATQTSLSKNHLVLFCLKKMTMVTVAFFFCTKVSPLPQLSDAALQGWDISCKASVNRLSGLLCLDLL